MNPDCPRAHGKSLFLGDEKLYVRGVTYGTFRPNDETQDFPALESVADDFAAMAANGINCLRTYTVPPRWLLDLHRFLGGAAVESSGLLITNARHHELLRQTSIELRAALDSITKAQSEEMVLVPLHNALRYLGEITGETTTEEILTQIFSTFCIGK